MVFRENGSIGKYLDILKHLLVSQQVGTLATQDREQPYTSLVAYAANKDMKTIIFVTSGDTRKYNNIVNNSKVSLLIHNYGGDVSDLNQAVAVTILGTAKVISPQDKDYLTDLYLAKYHYLENFVRQPENKLIMITVYDYIIATFGETKHLYAQDI